MRKLLKIAFRNVFRNKRRSIITFIAVSLGIFSYIAMEGLTDAINAQSRINLKKVETAHAKVFNKEYWDEKEKKPLDFLLTGYTKLESKIRKLEYVKGTAHRISFPLRVYTGRNEMPCMGIGIDITKNGDETVFDLKNSIVLGTYLNNGENALIGGNAAALLEIAVGDYLTIEFKDKNNIYDAIQVRISGIFDTGHPYIDYNVIYMPFDLVQEKLDMSGQCTEVAIKLSRDSKVKKLEKNIIPILGNNQVLMPWTEQAADFLKFAETDSAGNYIVVVILIIIIIAGIWNTMLMSVLERVREIGTMMALGLKKRQIQLLFLIEGGFIGFLGSLIGILFGLIFMYFFQKYGINFADLYGEGVDMGYLVKDYIYGSIRLKPYLVSLVLGLSVAFLSTFIPARNASKMTPAETLRKF